MAKYRKRKNSVLGKVIRTLGGFELIEFNDCYGVNCSLQVSSLPGDEKPGTSAVWLGTNDFNPRVLVKGEGWKPVDMPDNYIANTRMHLDRKQVQSLVNHLRSWLKKDTFKQ